MTGFTDIWNKLPVSGSVGEDTKYVVIAVRPWRQRSISHVIRSDCHFRPRTAAFSAATWQNRIGTRSIRSGLNHIALSIGTSPN